jgi:peptidoglycan hydrolase-like protein with peptidoglycan-binding domain
MSMTETSSLGIGARGEQVRQLQQALLDAGIQFRGGADGVFGPATQAALRQFQQQNNLPATGAVDSQTASVLMPVAAQTVRTPEQQAFYATLPPKLKAILDDEKQIQNLTDEFGQWAGFLYHPEIGKLLLEATGEGFTVDKFDNRLKATSWYRNTQASITNYEILKAQRPAELGVQIEKQKEMVRSLASGFGTQLADIQIEQLATNAVRLGYTEQQMANAVGSEVYKVGGVTPLRLGLVGQDVRALAKRFGIPLSNESLDNYTKSIATGNSNFQDYENYLRQQAISMFPSLQKEIERGLDIQTLADPYRETAARVLGLSPDAIDFADPKWNIALNFSDQSGRRMMNLEEWTRYIRSNDDYGYQYTDDAHNKAYMATSTIARAFGRL